MNAQPCPPLRQDTQSPQWDDDLHCTLACDRCLTSVEGDLVRRGLVGREKEVIGVWFCMTQQGQLQCSKKASPVRLRLIVELDGRRQWHIV
jgi:hypothetical protein